MTNPEDKRRFDELVPFYVGGGIGAAERAWVEAYLAREPGARAALAWHEALPDAIEEEVARVPADVGLALLRSRLAAARGGRLGWLERWLPRPAVYPAFAGAAALVLVQAVAIALLAGGFVGSREAPEFAQTRAIGEPRPRTYLQVNFKPATTERELRLALIRAGGLIVHGPGQLGDYYVTIAGERLDAARRELEASGIVEALAQVEKLPGREE
jgi:hypothetical protein